MGAQDQVQQDAAEQHEAQALEQLHLLDTFGRQVQPGQQGVTEDNPQSGSQQVDQGQAHRSLV
ncbi:hypothetical protein D3C80_2012350 [compost metagenome]